LTTSEGNLLPALQAEPVVVDTLAKAQSWMTTLLHYDGVCGIDTETSGIDPKIQAPGAGHGRIECWSISTDDWRLFIWGKYLEVFKPWLERAEQAKVGHNIYGFDWHMFANHGIQLSGIVADTLYISRLLYCSKERSHGLKQLALHWLGYKQPAFDSLFMRPKHKMQFVQETKKSKGVIHELNFRETKRKVGEQVGVPTLFATGERGRIYKGLEYIPLSEIPYDYPERLEALYDYASADAALTLALYYRFRESLEQEPWLIAK